MTNAREWQASRVERQRQTYPDAPDSTAETCDQIIAGVNKLRAMLPEDGWSDARATLRDIHDDVLRALREAEELGDDD